MYFTVYYKLNIFISNRWEKIREIVFVLKEGLPCVVF